MAVVRNMGELAVTNVPVVFFDGNPAAGGTLIGSTQTVAGVFAAGSNATVQVTWLVPPTTTNRTVYVVVDPAQTRPDRNRANNTASRSVLAADLQISDVTVVQNSATNRLLNARCVNTGVIPTGRPVDVVFRRWATNGPVLGTVAIADLPTNGVYDASLEWNLAGVTFTNAFELVYATVDAWNVISEADEGNNARVVSVMTSLDSDGDGLLDGEEPRYGTDPFRSDTDGDGLGDAAEVRLHLTNPLLYDTDGDGMSDGAEIAAGTDPNNAASLFMITRVLRHDDGSVSLHWTSASNKLYRVMRALFPARTASTTLTNNLPATPPVNTFVDRTATNATGFYWIEVQ
ncbi:MAG: CARDB domain-containing protein [Verrucomicrobiales bacterium]|nr:CARDB domain-containing protein [Verrucomicrobiales bacterium]